jgi:hypothetical protein
MKGYGKLIYCVVVLAVCAFGQSSGTNGEAAHPRYKLSFVLKQLDQGKVQSTHNYVTFVGTGTAQIRTGNRIPIDVGADKGIQYVDVGFNCDARIDGPIHENAVDLDIGWELSTMPAVTGSEKIIRQVKVRSTPNVPIGKLSIVGSADDVNSGQQYELWVTVTPEG